MGTEFEKLALEKLSSLQFELERVGGPNDEGRDLQGAWKLPDGLNLPTIVQCKRLNKKVGKIKFFSRQKKKKVYISFFEGTSVIRELEGTLTNERTQKIGVLVSAEGFSSETISRVNKNKLPMILVTIEKEGVTLFKLNASAQKLVPKLVVGSVINKSPLERKRTVLLLYDNQPLLSN